MSSNESGYDSDGPRGESAASENEAASLKCQTDSSDTSSVVDSEIEKPMRSSTPSGENQQQKPQINGYLDCNGSGSENLDGLRWHQTSSGRLLPSIHPANSSLPITAMAQTNATSSSRVLGRPDPLDHLQTSAHRIRLQQDKTKFLTDIIQPPSKVRRCKIIQLSKNEPKESLGIRLAQQRIGEVRYVVVQLEADGIAHR